MNDPHQEPGQTTGAASSWVSSSVLQRLASRDAGAWQQLVHVFGPLVRGWCQRARLQEQDAADVGQEVFRALAGNVSNFRREEGRNSFRGWLWGITQRQLLAHYRRQPQAAAAGGTEAQRRLADVVDPVGDEPSVADAAAEQSGVLQRALSLLQAEFEERTWKAFWLTAVDGLPTAEVAKRLGLSTNSVYLGRSRVLRRLREEFGDLLD